MVAKPEVIPVGPPVPIPIDVPPKVQNDRPRATFNLNNIGKVTKTTEEKPLRNGGADLPPDKDIDYETLVKVWSEFAEQRKGQVAEYQLLKGNIALDKNQVVLSLNNPIQEPLLHGIRTSLIGFLREKLGNNNVMVSGVLEQVAPGKVIYTNKEKFEHLADQYPVLKELKDRFGLDTDF